MDVNDILSKATAVVEFKPLWVALLVLSVTQMSKVVMLGNMSDGLHTILTRCVSGATGAITGYFLLPSLVGNKLDAVFLGLAISAAISLSYSPFTDWLESDPSSGWKTGLADFLAGRTFKPPTK